MAKKAPCMEIGRTFAANLARIIATEDKTPRAWAVSHHLEARNIHRPLKCEQSPSLDLLFEIAQAAGSLPWQLLVPNLDPKNPPVVTMTRTERDLYARLRESIGNLPTL